MKTPTQINNEAADILSKPGAWTKGVLARNKHGYSVSPLSSSAVCFCAYGAIQRAARNPTERWESREERAAIACLKLVIPEPEVGDPVVIFNDHTAKRKSTVIAALRRAAKRCDKESTK